MTRPGRRIRGPLRLGGRAAIGVLVVSLPAQGAFERPPVGPAEAALGGVLAVGADPVFGNPALTAAAGAGLLVWAARPFGLAELEESQAGGWMGGAIGPDVVAGVGVGFRHFGSAAWSEREARVVVAASPVAGIALAAAFRGLEAGGTGVAPRRSVALDVAFAVQAGAARIGGVVEAVVGEVPGDPGGLHRRSALGVSRDVGPGGLLLEVQRTESRALAARVGASVALPAGLLLRAGLRQDPAAVTWGFGVRIGPLRLDVAAAEGGPLGRTVRLGARLGRGGGSVSRTSRQ